MHHIWPFEPSLGSQHQIAIRRNSEDTTMTHFDKFFAKAIAVSAALSMTAGLALAGDTNVTAGQILDALKPKPVTRGRSANQHRGAGQGSQLPQHRTQSPDPLAVDG
jgi:hypothetical protein